MKILSSQQLSAHNFEGKGKNDKFLIFFFTNSINITIDYTFYIKSFKITILGNCVYFTNDSYYKTSTKPKVTVDMTEAFKVLNIINE